MRPLEEMPDYLIGLTHWLEAQGFRLNRDELLPNFGDRRSVYERGSIRIVIAQDRGDWYFGLELRNTDNPYTGVDLYNLDLFSTYLGDDLPVGPSMALRDQVAYLMTALERIESMLQEPDAVKRLNALARERSLRLLRHRHGG